MIGLDTSDMGDREPFGFHDSISQPIIEGLSKSGDKNNTVRAGEFVLGYPNGYGLYTDRPILPASAPGAGLLPRDPAGSGGADLGRNGTYLDLPSAPPGRPRVLALPRVRYPQPGRDRQRPRPRSIWGPGSWGDGQAAPRWCFHRITTTPRCPTPRTSLTTGADPEGLRCPIGAHVRRSNPRDSLDPDPGYPGVDRRRQPAPAAAPGREYGPVTTPRISPEASTTGPSEACTSCA